MVAKWRKFATKTNPKGVRCGTYGTEANTRGGVESEKTKCVGKKGEKKQEKKTERKEKGKKRRKKEKKDCKEKR